MNAYRPYATTLAAELGIVTYSTRDVYEALDAAEALADAARVILFSRIIGS